MGRRRHKQPLAEAICAQIGSEEWPFPWQLSIPSMLSDKLTEAELLMLWAALTNDAPSPKEVLDGYPPVKIK